MAMVKALVIAVLIFGLLMLAAVSILALSGGNNDNLRKGLEQFFREYTGYVATIEALEKAEFYPDLVMDIKNLALRRTANDPEPTVRIARATVRMRFWDAIFSRGLFSEFTFAGVRVGLENGFPGAIVLDKAAISPDTDPPVFAGQGNFKGLPLSFEAGIERVNARRGPLYRLGASSTATLSVGGLRLSGILEPVKGRVGFGVPDLIVAEDGASGRILARGAASLTAEGLVFEGAKSESPYRLKVYYNPGPEGLTPERSLIPHPDAVEGIEGEMVWDRLDAADLSAGGRLAVLGERLRTLVTHGGNLAGLSARMVLFSGPGEIPSGPFAGRFDCAGALAGVTGVLVTLDPVWIERTGQAPAQGKAQYALESQALSGGYGEVSGRAALGGFSDRLSPVSATCAAALRRWSGASATP